MQNSDTRLDRLFAQARTTPPQVPAEMPRHLQTRILAHWRTGAAAEDAGLWLVALFRRAVLCGVLTMAAAIVWSYSDLQHSPQNYEDLADYALPGEEAPR